MGFLRIILALAVVITHSNSFLGLQLTGGLVAVEIFFVISGFYMTMILDKKYIGKGSYKLFLTNRFLRLYPMFWAVLSLTALVSIACYFSVGSWFKLSSYEESFDTITLGSFLYLIVANLALFGQDVAMFLGMNKESGELFFSSNFYKTDPQLHSFLLVPQAWTLGVEATFYLIAPLIVRKSNSVIVAMIAASLCIRAFTYFHLGYTNDPWTYRFFPSEIALFLLGTISYRLYKRWSKSDLLTKGMKYPVAMTFLAIVIFHQFIPFHSGYNAHLINWFTYFLACLSLPFIFELTKSSKRDGRIGELSYPIYISHMLVISCISPLMIHLGMEAYEGEFAVILTLMVSYVLVLTISDPIEKVRQARVRVASAIYSLPSKAVPAAMRAPAA